MLGRLLDLAKKLNIVVGVGNADIFSIDENILKDTPFVNYDIDHRLNPKLTMADANSIIAIGLPYNTIYNRPKDNILRANMSSGAVGVDYHIIVKDKLQTIVDELLQDYKAMIFADTGPLIDREVAVRCGLGYIGKNRSVINKDIGSMFFIGYAITNVPFELWNFKNENIDSCGECNRCIKACPTGALQENSFDYTKCISYLTQKSGVLSDEECSNIGRQIYGCDRCQISCNKNSFVYGDSEYAYPSIEELLAISNKDFKRIYGITAAGWRGKKILQRNAIIALGNMQNERAIDILQKLTEDSRQEISQTAKWAIEKLRKDNHNGLLE